MHRDTGCAQRSDSGDGSAAGWVSNSGGRTDVFHDSSRDAIEAARGLLRAGAVLDACEPFRLPSLEDPE